MKNRTMLITAGFGLMMILSLFIGSVGAMADSNGALAAPAADITSVEITSPTNGAYLNNNDVLVVWEVTPAVGSENTTRIWNVTGGWGNWIDVTVDSHAFPDQIEGLHYVEVNATSDTDEIGMVANVSFTVDTIKPVVAVVLPFEEDQTNYTNFTIGWNYEDATPQTRYNVTISNASGIVGFTNATGAGSFAYVESVIGDDLDEGNYNVTVMVWDSASNYNSSGKVAFSIGPVVEFTAPSIATNNQNFTAEWEVSIVEGVDIAEQTLTIENETGDIFSVPLAGDVREYVIGDVTHFDLAQGNWTMTIDVMDEAGFNGSDMDVVIVDTVAPDVEIVVPADGEFINDNAFDAVWEFAADPLETPIAVQMVTISNETANMTLSVDPSELSVSVADVWGDVLPDGNYTIYVNATDAAGNWENESAAFVIDTEAPDVEFVVPDESVDPWYTSQVEFDFVWEYAFDPLMTPITSQTLTLANDTVNVTVDVPVGDLTIGSEAVWGDDLADGAYTLYMNVTDEAGNWENESVNFVVDTVATSVDVTYPPLFTNDNMVNATWEANGNGAPISNIELTIVNETGFFEFGPFNIGNAMNAQLSDFVGSALADGTWTLEFNVTDEAGNFVVVEYSFMVDTVNPTVTITAPIEGGFVNTTDVEIHFNATDTGVAQSGIEFLFISVDGGDWTAIDNSSAISYLVTGLAEGPHTVHVRAYDNAGNVGTAGVDFTVDLTAPLVEILSPHDGALFNVNELTIVWDGNDSLSGLAHFEVKVDSLDWEIVNQNTSMDLSGLADGAHEVLVKAVDNAGNENIANVSFIVDTTDPWVVITAPVNGLHTNVTSVRMNWTAVDNATDIAYIHVWNDSGAVVNLTQTLDNVTYLFTGLTEGAHTLHVQVWDLVGNTQEKSVSIVVDLTAPEVVITYPESGTRINDVSINATWIVIDELSPSIIKVEVAIDGGSFIDLPDLNTSHIFADVAVGEHVISVRVWDSAGNAGMNETTFIVDRTAPSVTAHTPASGAIVNPDAAVTVTFSKAMNQSSVTFTGITGTKAWNADGTVVTLTHAALSYATIYNVAVSGKDLAGNQLNTTGASWSFTVKTQVTGTINDDKGNPIVNATVTISQGGVTVAEGVTDANGHFALLVDGVGTYNVTVAKTGFQNLVQNDKTFGVGQTNSLGPMAMTPNADYTLLIVGVVVVVAIILAALYLMRRKPAAKKP